METVCTTDDPIDDLHYHTLVAKSELKTRMLPAWRPDKAMAPENAKDFRAYVEKLSAVSGKNISNFQDYVDALQERHDFFNAMGCRLSDHGIEEFYAEEYTDQEINDIFDKVNAGPRGQPKFHCTSTTATTPWIRSSLKSSSRGACSGPATVNTISTAGRAA